MNFRCIAILMLLTIVSTNSIAARIWDQGLKIGSVRSDYEPGVGAGGNWLSLNYVDSNVVNKGPEGCQFKTSDTFSGCPGTALGAFGGTLQRRFACGGASQRVGDSYLGCLSYDSSPFYEANYSGGNYWVVVANEDPAFDQCRKGPPGLSNKIVGNRSFNLNKVILNDFA